MGRPLSVHYKTLRSRLGELRRRFLPRQFSATGVYREHQLDRARAYRVLCHAEVESYIEARVQQISDAAIKQWKSNRKVCRALLGLILVDGEAKWPHKNVTADFISQRIDSCHRRFLGAIKDNHGLKEKHVVALLLRIGYDCHTLSPALLVELNAFGGKRGAIAHSSSAKLVAAAIDPQTELQAVESIVISLEIIDRELGDLLK